VASTGFFNAAEVELAANLVTERLTKGLSSGYHFVLAERGANLVGFACYGPIYGTRDSFELFWIAVAPEAGGGSRSRLPAPRRPWQRAKHLCRYVFVRHYAARAASIRAWASVRDGSPFLRAGRRRIVRETSARQTGAS
jgi:hypothetical protein